VFGVHLGAGRREWSQGSIDAAAGRTGEGDRVEHAQHVSRGGAALVSPVHEADSGQA